MKTKSDNIGHNYTNSDKNVSMETILLRSFDADFDVYESSLKQNNIPCIRKGSKPRSDDVEERDDNFQEFGFDSSDVDIDKFLRHEEQYPITPPSRTARKRQSHSDEFSLNLTKPGRIFRVIGTKIKECLAPYRQIDSPPKINIPIICIKDFPIDQSMQNRRTLDNIKIVPESGFKFSNDVWSYRSKTSSARVKEPYDKISDITMSVNFS